MFIAPSGALKRGARFMLEDVTVLVSLAILLLALVWLLARMVSALRLQRAWVKGWGGLAQQYGMTFNGGYSRCSVTGMYCSRIIYMLGSYHLGMALQMTTTNYTSNTLVMKANSLPPTLRLPDEATLFARGFTLVSGSQEFLDRLFLSHTLRERLAPLARTPGLVINLSGEELSLTTPRLYTQSDDLLRFLDVLSDLASGIEDIQLINRSK
jgi:hypothetical protein